MNCEVEARSNILVDVEVEARRKHLIETIKFARQIINGDNSYIDNWISITDLKAMIILLNSVLDLSLTFNKNDGGINLKE